MTTVCACEEEIEDLNSRRCYKSRGERDAESRRVVAGDDGYEERRRKEARII